MNKHQIKANWRIQRMPNTQELEALPVLCQGQAHDLHIDTGDARVWLARTSIEDGEPFRNTVYVELLDDDGRWIDAGYYDGDHPVTGGAGWTWMMFVGEF